ncbi:hypothetical protein R6Q57_015286 [Mikania cordata]
MATGSSNNRISAFPVTVFSHLLVASIATLVLYWLMKLKEGVAFFSHVKIQIFNASFHIFNPLIWIYFLVDSLRQS